MAVTAKRRNAPIIRDAVPPERDDLVFNDYGREGRGGRVGEHINSESEARTCFEHQAKALHGRRDAVSMKLVLVIAIGCLVRDDEKPYVGAWIDPRYFLE